MSLSLIQGYASHVVGGEIFYTRLAANQYEITFKIYFDCANANPGVIDRDGGTANVAIFDAATNTFIRSLTMRNAIAAEVNSVNYDCVKPPTGSCVVEYIFRETININPGTNGVIIAHQLCCRNDIITNVVNPGETGSTYWCKIPPNTTTNSSPRFAELPPTYVCLDAPLTVDYSATDPDGDSLVYEFYTPYVGASADDPKPDLPTRPPYARLFWQNSFTENNQVTGNPNGFVSSSTGEYTITPTRTGIFTLGIRVIEYRNGIELGSTFRDYQYSVVECEFDILANFIIPDGTTVDGSYTFECGDTVNIRNISVIKPGLTGTFFWDFGDPTTTTDTLTTFDISTPISYIYPGNGDYTITLLVTSSICTDEYEYNVRVRSTKGFTLGPDRIFCDSVRLLLNTEASDAVSVNWNTGQSSFFITARDSGTYIATVSYGNCSYADTVKLSLTDLPELDLPEDTLVCDSVFSLTLDAGFSGYRYQWRTPALQTTQTIDVNRAGTYTLQMSNTNCTNYDTIRVWQPTPPRISDTLFCNEFEYSPNLGIIEEADILWSSGSTTTSSTFTDSGTYWVQVTQRHCVNRDSFTIANSVVNLDLGENRHFCDSIDAELDAGPDGSTYTWNTGASSRTIRVRTADTFDVLVVDDAGCSLADTVIFTLTESPNIALTDDTTICVNSPTTIGIADPFVSYRWNTGQVTNFITTISEGNYVLRVEDEFGCSDVDSLYITVDPTALPDVLYIPNAFTPNQDGTNEWFPYSEEVIQPGFVVRVYSRWGEKLFDSELLGTTRWNGQYNGELIPPGVYIYLVTYRGCDGNARTDKGTLHAIY